MSQGFDPYHKWLGIPPEERPPSHYRLLGIPLYEADQEVIASAAVQRMNWLRKFQSGENGTAAQRLTKEIADAWACLLNPQRRQEYDQQLNAQFAGLRNTLAEAIADTASNASRESPAETIPPFLVEEIPPAANYSAPPLVVTAAIPQTIPATAQFISVAEPPSSNDVVIHTGSRRSAAQNRKSKPSFLAAVIRQVSASFFGLVLGYLILCKLDPRYDFLHIFPQPQPTATKPADGIKKPTAPAVEPPKGPGKKVDEPPPAVEPPRGELPKPVQPLELPKKEETSPPDNEKPITKPPSPEEEKFQSAQLSALRRGELRKDALEFYGGNDSTETCTRDALSWLVRNQRADGLWSLKGPYSNGGSEENLVAATAMALLALQGDGYPGNNGKHAMAFQRGWTALLKGQSPEGQFITSGLSAQHQLYTHAIATCAVCDRYAMAPSSTYRKVA